MGLDPKRIEVMNAIASAMMDGAMPLLRHNPPDVAFEAVTEVAELTLNAAKQLEEDEV